MPEQQVLCEVHNGAGWITLNRPKSVNSLTLDMVTIINQALDEWKAAPEVQLVCISGAGDKGLCAGGDMKRIYEERQDASHTYARQFFGREYAMDLMIHQYPKPILVYMDGIVMGGGVGLSIGASYRLATESTKWAMPEAALGFYPDVGSSHFFSHMPNGIGNFLALTGTVLRAEDMVFVGAADRYIPSTEWPLLRAMLYTTRWTKGDVHGKLRELWNSLTTGPPRRSALESDQAFIRASFSRSDVLQIISSLEHQHRSGVDKAAMWLQILQQQSPTSLKVIANQLEVAKTKPLAECFEMEFALSLRLLDNPNCYEGIRAILVDKDKSPRWEPSTIEDVDDRAISEYFAPPTETEAWTYGIR